MLIIYHFFFIFFKNININSNNMDTLISRLFNKQLQLQNHLGYENNTEFFEGKYNNNSKVLDVIV